MISNIKGFIAHPYLAPGTGQGELASFSNTLQGIIPDKFVVEDYTLSLAMQGLTGK